MAEARPPQPDQTSPGSLSSDPTSASASSKPSDRPLDLREDISKPPNLDPSESTSTTANTTSNRTTPHTPFTPSTSASVPPQPPQFRVPASPRSATMTPEESSKAAKVAIPRLKRTLDTGDVASKPGGRHRVTHACEPCRHRKTKCSGERPTCRHCQDFKIQCYYADGKRDRVKKYVTSPGMT